MKAEQIDSGLQPRMLALNRLGQRPERHFVILSDGAAEIETSQVRTGMAAPAIAWLGEAGAARIRIEAGAAGYHSWIDEQTVAAATGDTPDSPALAAVSGRDFVLSLAGFEQERAAIERCCAAAIQEQAEKRPGAPLLASALLRIVLVLLLRVSGGREAFAHGGGERQALLQRFRQLVEMNFRNHWTVAQYAQALSISTDRLHAICTDVVGKPPKTLVCERLAHEAASRLEHSALTIEQLGHLLGFGDPAHFSNFFRRMWDMPPGRYRRVMAEARAEGRQKSTAGFAEWP